VGRLGGQGVEQFGRSEALVSGLNYHLFLLNPMHSMIKFFVLDGLLR